MRHLISSSVLAFIVVARAAKPHGEGAEGTVMGPVAFLWPEDRQWSADADNIGPCGSGAAISNRTLFPLGRGAVALSIADEAWELAIRIAYGNNPVTQSEFHAIKGNVTEVDPGHQCYGIPNIPSTVAEGSNATIQLEYWSNDSNKNESFFACADIKFVRSDLFTAQIPCFNVTAGDFNLPPATTTTAASRTPSATQGPIAATSAAVNIGNENGGGGGLSTGAKAGIGIGVAVGVFSIIAALAILGMRRRQARRWKRAQAIDLVAMKRTLSQNSGEVATS